MSTRRLLSHFFISFVLGAAFYAWLGEPLQAALGLVTAQAVASTGISVSALVQLVNFVERRYRANSYPPPRRVDRQPERPARLKGLVGFVAAAIGVAVAVVLRKPR